MVILGIALLLAGAGLLVAEAHLPTYGVLGLAGLVALVVGGVVAVDASGRRYRARARRRARARADRRRRARRRRARRARRRPAAARPPAPRALVGRVGVAAQRAEPVGQVFVDGALWRARPVLGGRPSALHEGDHVVVERVQGLTLSVRRAEEWELEA